MGGFHNRKTSSLIQRIDPVTGVVTTVGQLPHKVAIAAGVVVDGKGYLFGGEAKKPLGLLDHRGGARPVARLPQGISNGASLGSGCTDEIVLRDGCFNRLNGG